MAADHRFRSITEVWLEGDHYKWRAMRTNGVAERFCTGDASDWEKFEAWARTVPDTLGNPLYHWTHMELRRPFGIETLLSPATARATFDRANERLKEDAFTRDGPPEAVPRGGGVQHRRPHRHARAPREARAAEGPRHAGLPDLAAGQGRSSSRTSRRGPPGSGSWRRPPAPRSGPGTRSSPPSRSATRSSTSAAAGPPTTASRRSTPIRSPTRWRRASSPGSGRARRSTPGEALRLPLGPPPPPGAPRPRARLGAAVPRGRDAQQQHAHEEAPRPRHRLRLDRRRRAGPAARPASSTASTRPTSSRRRSSTT